jgi:hypothetical protein
MLPTKLDLDTAGSLQTIRRLDEMAWAELVTYRRYLVRDSSVMELDFVLHATLCRDTMTIRMSLTKPSRLSLLMGAWYLHATILAIPTKQRRNLTTNNALTLELHFHSHH